MFSRLFDMDNPFWRWVGKIPDYLGLSLLFYLCCIPVVTIIPAACALFDAVSRCTVLDERGCFARFFRTFYKELKQGIPLSLLFLAIVLIALYGRHIIQYSKANSDILQIFSLMYLIILISIVSYLHWLVPLQSRYYHSFFHLLRNAFLFSICRLPGTVGMFLISAAVLFISTLSPYTLPMLLIAPGLTASFHSYIVERGFEKAFPQEKSELPDTGA